MRVDGEGVRVRVWVRVRVRVRVRVAVRILSYAWVQVSGDGGEIVEKFVVQQFIWPRARMVAILVWVGLGLGLVPQRIAMAISPVWRRPGALSLLLGWAASVLAPLPLSLAFEASLPSASLVLGPLPPEH